ncbi:type IV secretion system protein TrbL [Rhodococcus tukisamuensis]|uniref:Type IV secretion system protein TrbL n=1 Tax=Rhodococcus tukisamuensis TaxID=168276 RepID=A0A1G7DYL4_9NOCA|nr:type IV secretion system protein TrbL [Rhodococcus tukisamuensis]
MSRNLARRGASVLVAAALLGGGLALGGGTASAEEPGPASGGSLSDLAGAIFAPPAQEAGSAAGSLEAGSAAVGSSDPCPGFSAGEAPGCVGPFRVLPDELGVVVRVWLKTLPGISS